MKNDIWRILSFFIIVIFIFLLINNLDSSLFLDSVSKINYFWVSFSFLLYFSTYLVRTYRINSLLKKSINFKRLFPILIVHNFFVSLLPARLGEVSYFYLLKKEGVALAKSLNSLVLIRIIDASCIFLIFIISLLFLDLQNSINNKLLLTSLFFLTLSLFFVFNLKLGYYLIDKIPIKFNIFLRFKKFIKNLSEESKGIKKSDIFEMLFISLIFWVLQFSVNYFIIKSIGIDLGFFALAFCSVFPTIVSLIPIQPPAGIGTTEGAWTIGFLLLGLTLDVALVSSLILHFFALIFMGLTGFIGLILLRKNNS